MTTRARPAPATATITKPPTNIAPTCVIADSASLVGTHPITLGDNVVLHPRSRINSSFGPVTIGPLCIVSEKASVGRLRAESEDAAVGTARSPTTAAPPGVVLEARVVLEAGAICEAACVGEGTRLEAASRVGAGAVVGKHCTVAPLCTVAVDENLPDLTVIWGLNQRRFDTTGLQDLQAATHDKEVEILRRLIPSNIAKWQTT